MKAREKILPLFASNQLLGYIPFYERTSRDQMTNSTFYQELVRNYIRFSLFSKAKKYKFEGNAKKQICRSQEELLLSFRFKHG